MNLSFYKGKRVFITGHTGFKGSWLTKVLVKAGAIVTGYSLEPNTQPNLFELCELENSITSITGDIRNLNNLKKAFDDAAPEIVFHLAAQPIVRDSYKDPVYTYETNVIGTVNIMECIRLSKTVKSVVNVTTDKVYKNNEWVWGYRENEELDGFDPYSNSKSCSELVTFSYKRSFLNEKCVSISTARAGNVIGGGDFSNDRIIPDCIKAAQKYETINVRNPKSIRPYQHVLEPIFAYLLIAEKQYNESDLSGSYNVGPDEIDCITTGNLVDIFCKLWGENQSWTSIVVNGPHEASLLKLDCSKIKNTLGWKTTWNVEKAIEETVLWNKAYLIKEDISNFMDVQIERFMKDYKGE